MNDKIIIGLIAQNDSEILTDSTSAYCYAFQQAGFRCEPIDFRQPAHLQRLTDLITQRAIAFGFGLQGIGSILKNTQGQSLWSDLGVPFVGIHHDHPSRNPNNHFSPSPFVGNLYRFKSFLDVRERYLPKTPQLSAYAPFRLLHEVDTSTALPFKDRPIRLLFVKMGFPLDELERQIDTSPRALRDGLRDLLALAWREPNHELCDLVASLYSNLGIDPLLYQEQFWTHVNLCDFYLRRKRAITFVESLKKQEGAVIIGDGWDFIDKEKARATFQPTTRVTSWYTHLRETQFLCNTNPYGADIMHERVMVGLAFNCCILTDSNAWWDTNLGDVPALKNIIWTEDLDAQIQNLTDPAQPLAEHAATGLPAAKKHFSPAPVTEIVTFAEKIAAHAAALTGKR